MNIRLNCFHDSYQYLKGKEVILVTPGEREDKRPGDKKKSRFLKYSFQSNKHSRNGTWLHCEASNVKAPM